MGSHGCIEIIEMWPTAHVGVRQTRVEGLGLRAEDPGGCLLRV